MSAWPTRTTEGWTASVYATYLQDEFFIDRPDQGRLPHLGANAFGQSGSVSVDTWGGQVESGYRIPIGHGHLEPVAPISYAQTTIGDSNVFGTILHWGDEDSFRGATGFRLSMPVMNTDTLHGQFAVRCAAWDEFDGMNRVALVSTGPITGVEDNFSGAFGEVGGALNLYSKDGHSRAS